MFFSEKLVNALMLDLNNFVIDPYCDGKYNYFGLDKVILKAANEASITCHVNSVLDSQLLSAAAFPNPNDFWLDKLDQCVAYKIIGYFGDMKLLENYSPICVVKENLKNLNSLLEFELYKKQRNWTLLFRPYTCFEMICLFFPCTS